MRRPFLLLAALGAGLIAANAGKDAGGIVANASAGAEFAVVAVQTLIGIA